MKHLPTKFLVLDDDAGIVEFVTVGLQDRGFDVLSAQDGQAGLSLARMSKPDLIVLDLTMPRMHGYQVCQEVRSDKDIARTKIIITSGKNFPVDKKTAVTMGADMYIVKPFRIEQLADAI